MSRQSVEVEIEPRILTWARESMGYTIPEIAEKIRVNSELIVEYEKGTKRPSMAQLRRISAYYKRPVAVFFLSEPPEELPVPVDFRTLPGENSIPISPKTRLAIRRARRLQGIYLELNGADEENITTRFRQIRTTEDAEQISQEVREAIGVTIDEQTSWKREHEALNRWREAIENQGVLVIQLSLPVEEARAFSLSDGGPPAIVINSKDPPKARMFSLMHELCHILLHDGGLCIPERAITWDLQGTSSRISIRDTERYCNHFAGSMLVPKSDFLDQPMVKHTDHERTWPERDLQRLARRYWVSKEVVLRRLLLFEKTSRRYYQQKREDWKKKRMMREEDEEGGGGNIPTQCIAQNGRTVVSMIIESYRKDKITYNDVGDFLEVKLKHIPEIEKRIGAH